MKCRNVLNHVAMVVQDTAVATASGQIPEPSLCYSSCLLSSLIVCVSNLKSRSLLMRLASEQAVRFHCYSDMPLSTRSRANT